MAMKRMIAAIVARVRRSRRVATYDDPGPRFDAGSERNADKDLALRNPVNFRNNINGGDGFV
jgi:hypothetical protein